MEVDYIIVGQGLSGSFLSSKLFKAGKKIVVIDDASPNVASKIASGVINPVTGRRIVSTWMIENLLPYSFEAYTEFGTDLNATLITQKNILDFHPTLQMQLAFKDKIPVENNYLRCNERESELKDFFNFNYGVGEINPCYLIDVSLLITEWRKQLSSRKILIEEEFITDDLTIINHDSEGEESVEYRGIKAKKVIFCDGAKGVANPWFKLLPYAKNKGEALIVEIDGLPRNNIYKHGLSLVPWKENLWWIGSTYDWNFSDLNPTAIFRIKAEQTLQHWVKLPYKVVGHLATERPANLERRPFVGLHPIYSSIGILNGMGTKGCSLVPYFSNELTANLLYNTPINPLADVQRFRKILSRAI